MQIRLRPRPRVAGYFRKRRHFSPNTATAHTYPAFSGTENGGFQIRSPGSRFLKTEIHRIRVDRRKQRFSNTMTSCLASVLARPLILFENATRGRRFFLNTEKKISVFENIRLRVDGQIRFENATCGRRFF